MRTMMFLILLFCAAPVLAGDRLARQGEDWVRFTDKPCTNDLVLARLLPSEAENWHAASSWFQGKTYQACWREVRSAA